MKNFKNLQNTNKKHAIPIKTIEDIWNTYDSNDNRKKTWKKRIDTKGGCRKTNKNK